jgi:ribosomal protein S18 acetylase RimI-like enzyme
VATEIRLRDGTLGVTWALLPGDREKLAKGYEALSPESKFHRFLTGVPHLTETMLNHLVDDVDGVNHVALVLFCIDAQGLGTPAGVGHVIRYPDKQSEADIAVTVGEEFRGRGVASALLAELVAERPQGVELLRTSVAAGNSAALAMLKRLGPTTVTASDGRYDVVVQLSDSAMPQREHRSDVR